MKTACCVTLFGLAVLGEAGAEEKRAVPLYTNQDLDRVSPYRGQTGVLSEPTLGGAPVTPPEPRAPEEYWRREAARVRARVRALEERAEEIRRELGEARTASPPPWSSRPRSRSGPSSAPREARLAAREARLAAIERQVRELESDLADRARRARALPGWLR